MAPRVGPVAPLQLSLACLTLVTSAQSNGGAQAFMGTNRAILDAEAAEPPTEASTFDLTTTVTGSGAVAFSVILDPMAEYIHDVAGIGLGDASIILRWTTMLHVAWFDAIAPYHPTAVGVYSNLGRRPDSESETDENLNIALLYASHKIFSWMGPEDYIPTWDALLVSVGLDPTDTHEGTEDPIGIGNAAAAAVIAARSNDGFNQLGFDDGRTYNPKPYADYTGYDPVNSPYELTDARKWQPDLISDSITSLTKAQSFVHPQFRLTAPFTYSDPLQFSSPRPDKSYDVAGDGSGEPGESYRAQADEVIAVSANLTDAQKLTAEYFDSKFGSLGGSMLLTVDEKQLSIMEFVHIELVVNVAAFDAGIAIWQEKAQWNAVRPFSAVAHLYADEEITAYGGPGQGTVDDITGGEWRPYMQSADHPEYPSGSSAFCAAHAEGARLFLGSDDIEIVSEVEAGGSIREPGVTPAEPTTLTFSSWTQFETDCANSRVLGGVHFPDALAPAISIGKETAKLAYQFYLDHVNGEGVAGSLRGVDPSKR